MSLSYNRSKKAQVIHDYKLTTLGPYCRDQAWELGPLQLAFEQMPPVLLEALCVKSSIVSSLLTPEDLIPSSRGLKAEINGRGVVLVSLIWASSFETPYHLSDWGLNSSSHCEFCCPAAPFQTWGRKSWACAKSWLWLDFPSGVNLA